MLPLLWRSLRGHARRMVATGLAVLFAVGFISGTFIFTDTARAGFYDTYARTARSIDVSVLPARGTLDASQLALVRSVAGVGVLDARMVAPLGLEGREGRLLTNFGQAGYVVSTDSPPTLRPFDVQGALPQGSDDALVDVDTAAHQHWVVGDPVTVVDSSGTRHRLRISGLIDFGVTRQYSGNSVVGLPAARITALTGETGYHEIVATAAAGADPAALVRRVRAAVGASPMVETGDQRRKELADDATSVAGQFQLVLLIFGVIALIVATFVIYNTFAILLAQRVRETALLRCVGATRRQVFTLAVAEAATIGLTAAILGLGVGAFVAYGLIALLNRFAGAGIPTHGITVTAGSAVIGIVTGVVVTIGAALLPAVRATRVTAMAAMRDEPAGRETARWKRVVRVVLGTLVGGGGAAVTAAGVADADPQAGTFLVVVGGVLAFGGLLIWTPLFIGPLVAVVGRPLRLLFKAPGRLAVANARRNPGRTAITTATLMIGIGIMALFCVVLGSVTRTASDQLTSHYPVDYVMTGVAYGDAPAVTVPAAYAARLRQLPQFAAVAEIRTGKASIAGRSGQLAAIDPAALGTVAKPRMVTGTLAALGPGTVVLPSTRAAPPSTVTVRSGRSGGSVTLRVVGTAVLSLPSGGAVDGLVSWDEFRSLLGPGDDATVLAKAGPGVTPVASRDALDALAEQYPLVGIGSVADLRSGLDTAIAQLLTLFGGLLGTTVLISLFGIANTLALSVRERTRESAIIRALGLTRSQLRLTLLLEALLMGVVGALVGIAFGLVYGRLVVRTAFVAIRPTIVVPWTWIGGLVVLAAVAAVLAAVLPARRAANASPVEAMADGQ